MGMNTCDMGVFVFLFTQRWAENKYRIVCSKNC